MWSRKFFSMTLQIFRFTSTERHWKHVFTKLSLDLKSLTQTKIFILKYSVVFNYEFLFRLKTSILKAFSLLRCWRLLFRSNKTFWKWFTYRRYITSGLPHYFFWEIGVLVLIWNYFLNFGWASALRANFRQRRVLLASRFSRLNDCRAFLYDM